MKKFSLTIGVISVNMIEWNTAQDSDWARACDFKLEHFQKQQVI